MSTGGNAFVRGRTAATPDLAAGPDGAAQSRAETEQAGAGSGRLRQATSQVAGRYSRV